MRLITNTGNLVSPENIYCTCLLDTVLSDLIKKCEGYNIFWDYINSLKESRDTRRVSCIQTENQSNHLSLTLVVSQHLGLSRVILGIFLNNQHA